MRIIFLYKFLTSSKINLFLLDKADVKYHVTPTNYPWLYEKDFHKDEMDDEFYFPKGW